MTFSGFFRKVAEREATTVALAAENASAYGAALAEQWVENDYGFHAEATCDRRDWALGACVQLGIDVTGEHLIFRVSVDLGPLNVTAGWYWD